MMFKYWLRFLALSNDSLLKETYKLDCDSIDKNRASFTDEKIAQRNGLGLYMGVSRSDK
jgi:hypothetical protein